MALWKAICILQIACAWAAHINVEDPNHEQQHWVERLSADGPAPRGGGTSGTGGPRKRACIHGGDSVRTPNGPIRIAKLQIGDMVQVDHEKYEPIIAFLHRDTSRNATGFKLSTGGDQSVILSDEHLVFVGPAKRAVFAKNVKVGDFLHLIQNGKTIQSRVVKVERAQLEGRYSPLTPSGVLVVNGVMVSCYSVVEDHHLMHTAVQWLLSILPDRWIIADWSLAKNGGMHWLGDALWYHMSHWFFDFGTS